MPFPGSSRNVFFDPGELLPTKNLAPDQIVDLPVGPVGDDALGEFPVNARKALQIPRGRRIDVNLRTGGPTLHTRRGCRLDLPAGFQCSGSRHRYQASPDDQAPQPCTESHAGPRPTSLARCIERIGIHCSDAEKKWGQASRPISTSKLNAFLRLHPWPINLVISEGSLGACAREISSWGRLHA